MGERQNGPLGIRLHFDPQFAPGFQRYGLPSRFVLPGPLGTPSWSLAATTANRHATRAFPALPATDLNYEKLYKDLQRWEGVVTHTYLDTHRPKQLVTVGAGNMLPDTRAAQALPFVNLSTGNRATMEEIEAAFNKVSAMQGRHYAAAHYKLEPSIEIAEAKAKELAIARLKREYIPGIRRWVRGFDYLPFPAQEALIDMAYNAGVGRDARVVNGKEQEATGLHQYTKLKRAVEAGNWLVASRACRSSTSRQERNDWRSDLFMRASRIAAATTNSMAR